MNRILLRAAYAALLLCAFCVPTLRAQDDAVAARLREHLNYLCSDQLAGRYPGTAGNKLAAEYIATKLQAAGCKPLSTSFYQEFSIPFSVSMTGDNSAFFDIIVPKVGVPADALRPVRRTWKLGSDFTPLGFSASKSVSGNVVFCGYGVSNKEKNYDDYTGVDVKGKIAIILTGDMNTTNLVNKFKISTNTLRNRAINAREHGAIGVVFVHPQGDSSEILMPLRFESRAIVDDMPIIHVRRSIVTPIFPKDRQLIQEEEQIIKTKQPRSYEIPNTKMTLTVNLKIEEAMISNVVGYIAGTDPQKNNQMIVVGAHYDHLGMGDEHSLYDGGDAKIHYGADDNASGTAGVLELAAAIGAKPLPNPVLFIAFNAEERGLLGVLHEESRCAA
ncbi:MAG: M28 family peptidase [Candidatus Kapabacteria bacterium]|nr:M28 family peptidase [Candidatus Kapabacteria bacterium]